MPYTLREERWDTGRDTVLVQTESLPEFRARVAQMILAYGVCGLDVVLNTAPEGLDADALSGYPLGVAEVFGRYKWCPLMTLVAERR